MKERIGTTRSGKPIELIWFLGEGHRILASFSQFTEVDDQFDCLAVMEARWVFAVGLPEQAEQGFADVLEKAIEEMLGMIGASRIWEKMRELGLATSAARVKFARANLLYPQVGPYPVGIKGPKRK